jgi:photosystem II stability/assembly factor-like uncharacterized protein
MALAGLVALGAGVLPLVLAPGGPGPLPGNRQSAYQFDQRADPLPTGSLVPTTSLTDVDFTGPDAGFALAEHRDRLVLAATTDGGDIWRVVDGRLPIADLGLSSSVQMEFTSRRKGYMWVSPAPAASSSGMWRTADGGATWRRTPLGPLVYDVSAIGRNVWVLVGACSTPGAACTLTVDSSSDGGATWELPRPLLPGVTASASQPESVELARVSPLRAYVLSLVPGGPASLVFTADGGASWSPRPVPCAGPFDLGAELALSSTADLWMVCGGQGSAGAQAKALYRSSTGGASWSLAAQTPAFAGAPAAPPGVGTLPFGGYVEPYWIGHKNLAVVSQRLAWLFPGRASVLATTDGGANWAPVRDLEQAGFGTGAPGNVTFISAGQGWVSELGVGLFETTDGSSWRSLGT